jgi:hypothetical protein
MRRRWAVAEPSLEQAPDDATHRSTAGTRVRASARRYSAKCPECLGELVCFWTWTQSPNELWRTARRRAVRATTEGHRAQATFWTEARPDAGDAAGRGDLVADTERRRQSRPGIDARARARGVQPRPPHRSCHSRCGPSLRRLRAGRPSLLHQRPFCLRQRSRRRSPRHRPFRNPAGRPEAKHCRPRYLPASSRCHTGPRSASSEE